MKIKDYLKSVDKQLTDVSPDERKKILGHLQKSLKKFLKTSQEKAIANKLGDPAEYGKALNSHYKLFKTTNDIRLIIPPLNGKNGKNGKNGRRNFLKEMKFIISADMIMPVPTHYLWFLGVVSVSLLAFFTYALYAWSLWNLGWILAPAFIANGAALYSRKIKFLEPLAIPVDLESKWIDRRRVIGNSKTLRGFIFGMILSILAALVIFFASEYLGIKIFSSLSNAVFLGALVGLGALLADAVKSFFKRRMGIKEGKNLLFFDQLDFLIGAFLIATPFIQFPLKFILVVITGTFILHILMNVFAFYMHLKKVPW
jgi:CDP-2,3-bis-(O-geranylgeranyl)-sn-glycerol synthase